MAATTEQVHQSSGEPPPDHVDVLIVGAGLSGIGAACHLQANCPGRTFAILEARERIGGTWDLFRYPGIRSDSDMYTLGYTFRPWRDAKAIADGPSILRYVHETAREHGIEPHIRFGRRAVRALWDSEESRWTVEARCEDSGETVRYSCGFLLMCSGYYRYDEGYSPQFAGSERYAGEIVHPQFWGEDVDYDGKRVIVIGSGATAVTLVPAMAERAEHVTMLQRSPSYIVSLPAEDAIANKLRRLLPAMLAYQIVRWKNVLLMMFSFQLSRRRPEVAKRLIRKGLEKRLPADYDFERHFSPPYNPWQQRMCLVPDGDLFEAINAGRAAIVTDTIERFTERGIRLSSGLELQADLIVTATGLNLQLLGGMQLVVDGREVTPSDTLSYKGMMLSGVPNLAMTFGYTNASWTLKCDLTCAYVCRILNHMAARGYARCTPTVAGGALESEPFIDFSSGYVQRAIHKFPKQGASKPWRVHQNYALDIMSLRFGSIEDSALRFERAVVRTAAPTAEQLAA